MRNAYLQELFDLAQVDRNILAVVADNGAIVYDKFRQQFPDQFINFGIAEANMVAASAGMASCGKIPFLYTIIPFLTMRAYEFVRNDICLQKSNVKLVGIGGGVVYSSLGPTHHALEDIAIMRVLPELRIFVPASPKEARAITRAAANIDGPVYIRLGTTKELEIYDYDIEFQVGKANIIRAGQDVTIVVCGSIINEAIIAADVLQEQGIDVRIINMASIKPLDKTAILSAVAETRAIISLEEHSINGGLGGAIAELLAEESPKHIKFKRLGFKDFCRQYGSYADLKKYSELDSMSIVNTIKKILA